MFEDRKPRRELWLPFKVGSFQRLESMRKGLLYMNSLEYFSSLKGEEAIDLRKDELEKVYASFKIGDIDDKKESYYTMALQIGEGDNKREIEVNEGAKVTIGFPEPENTMLFCMGALADGDNGLIPGEEDGKFYFDRKFLDFGDHILFITAPSEFSKRINSAIRYNNDIYSSEFMEGGYGLIDYVDMSENPGPIGLFRKDIRYEWQREFRISFGVHSNALNDSGAYEFDIGDISDISNIAPLQAFINEPIVLKRRVFKKINGEYKQA